MDVPQLSRPLDPPVLDDKVWQAWLAKNRRNEHLHFVKRLKIMFFLSPLLLAALLFWVLRAF